MSNKISQKGDIALENIVTCIEKVKYIKSIHHSGMPVSAVDCQM